MNHWGNWHGRTCRSYSGESSVRRSGCSSGNWRMRLSWRTSTRKHQHRLQQMLAPWDWGRSWFKNNHMVVSLWATPAAVYQTYSVVTPKQKRNLSDWYGLVRNFTHTYMVNVLNCWLTINRYRRTMVPSPNPVPGSSVGCYVSSHMHSR